MASAFCLPGRYRVVDFRGGGNCGDRSCFRHYLFPGDKVGDRESDKEFESGINLPFHSDRRLCTGLANAALTERMLIVRKVINKTMNPAPTNIHQGTAARYAKP